MLPRLKKDGSDMRMLNCSSRASPILCVQSSPNPEFAANPGNFAHFILAHLFPVVRELDRAGVHDPFRATLLLWHGSNRVLPIRWDKTFLELLGPNARCTNDKQ